MNVKRFTARTPRDALALVRQAFGEDAVVISTRPCPEGVEVLAMAPESVSQLERVRAAAEPPQVPAYATPAAPTLPVRAPAAAAAPARGPATRGQRIEPTLGGIDEDVQQLEMSTLSFQDYVRERMLKRRQSELAAAASAEEPARPLPPVAAPIDAARNRLSAQQAPQPAAQPLSAPAVPTAFAQLPQSPSHSGAPLAATAAAPSSVAAAGAYRDAPVLREEVQLADGSRETAGEDRAEMMTELRSMRGLIEQRFGALAFMEKLQRQPRQAQMSQKLLDIGFSAALVRKLAESLPDDVAEIGWAAGVLERNLATGERDGALEDLGGVYALVGATGVGKTTSTAKLAAAFAAKHGAANLGLITLDAYRIGAHEQLRTYGRILGVPVHTAHDRASLEDLLDLLSGKRMVLIDTAGMAQRDNRTRELLEMLSHPLVKKVLVINASAQGETIEDQLVAYGAPTCRGVVLSKVDEAVKLGPALDAMIRARLKVLAVANGQRVPEDWHRLSAGALVQRALKAQGGLAWRLDDGDVSLIFAGLPVSASTPAARLAAQGL